MYKSSKLSLQWNAEKLLNGGRSIKAKTYGLILGQRILFGLRRQKNSENASNALELRNLII